MPDTRAARTRPAVPIRMRPRGQAAAPATEDAGAGRAKALRIIGSIVANTTLLTALLFYFGFLYTQVFFAYFRVHYTILNQPLQEVLARGADGLLLPLAVLASAILVGILILGYLRTRLSPETRRATVRMCTPPAAAAGLTMVGVAVFIALDPAPFRRFAGLPGLGFAVGVLLLAFAWRQLTDRISGNAGAAVWGLVFLLVSVGLFWAVGDYSSAVSVRRGYEVEARIPAMPSVVVYSARSLRLTGVHETTCASADAAYRYRYDGLKLLLQSGGQYVFVPATWHRADGTAYVVPESGSLRLEFGPPPRMPPPTC